MRHSLFLSTCCLAFLVSSSLSGAPEVPLFKYFQPRSWNAKIHLTQSIKLDQKVARKFKNFRAWTEKDFVRNIMAPKTFGQTRQYLASDPQPYDSDLSGSGEAIFSKKSGKMVAYLLFTHKKILSIPGFSKNEAFARFVIDPNLSRKDRRELLRALTYSIDEALGEVRGHIDIPAEDGQLAEYFKTKLTAHFEDSPIFLQDFAYAEKLLYLRPFGIVRVFYGVHHDLSIPSVGRRLGVPRCARRLAAIAS